MRFARYPAIALLFFVLGYWLAPEPDFGVQEDGLLELYWPSPLERAVELSTGTLPRLPWGEQVVPFIIEDMAPPEALDYEVREGRIVIVGLAS